MSDKSELKATEPKATSVNDDLALAIMALAESIKVGQVSQSEAASKIGTLEQYLLNREAQQPNENLYPPMMSAYNPEGDRDAPRPELKCQMLWTGYRMTRDSLSVNEINLLNRVEAGNYRVTKADGTTVPFTITEKIDNNGKLERLAITFPCKSTEDRSNHLSMTSYLSEVLGDTETPEQLRSQLDKLRAMLKVA